MSMSISDLYTVPDEWRTLSSLEPAPRKVGGEMGKHDFLMLLSAQLRFQDPLDPVKDSDFAAQLAQFSALEQMENMNQTLAAMSNYQAFGLVGKFVVATAYVDGVLSHIPGIVDCVFTENGVTFAQIGKFSVPVSSVTEVYDNTNMLTPNMLIEISNNLIGRTVRASFEDKELLGVVTSVYVEDGEMWARIVNSATGREIEIPIGCIYDIRQDGLAPPPVEDDPEDEDGEKTLEELLSEADAMYVGQTVSAQIGDDLVEGVVKSVGEEEGVIYANIETDSGDEYRAPVEDIEILLI